MTNSLRAKAHRDLVAIIREARYEAGLTQRDLAAKLQVPQTWIAMLEMGRRRVDIVEFISLANALGIKATELLQRVENR